MDTSADERFDIAVIGMAGRFPGATSLAEYWDNLISGRESIQLLSQEELLQRGVSMEQISAPTFVPACAAVAESDLFAASFFGYSPHEAELMDPQQRLFLECAWQAMEDAGYAKRSLPFPVGVFAGASLSTYLLFNLLPNADQHVDDQFQMMIGSDKDFLSTRVSYKLNLNGPSFTIQSGCSTSLVAVHMAIQNLLTYQCDLAIAGGVSIGVPQKTGYVYQPGGVLSADGHCKAFDVDADGTVFGEGVGVVVLKRCKDAIRDGDNIHAVVLGSAINNDGSAKIGYTAPSVQGQAEVITRAHVTAGINADTIGYIEAHGTATALGDPIEITALTQAFRTSTQLRNFCAVGSVKANIGHLDAAAGIAGFIKTVLMLKHRMLPPSLHFNKPNPKIDFESSPFFVVTRACEWHSVSPRRAGVSSFGIGGSNAHVVVEEAPSPATEPIKGSSNILSLSAQTSRELESMTENLVGFLEHAHDDTLADVAYTLHLGREAFKHRRSIVASTRADAVRALRGNNPDTVFTGVTHPVSLRAAFLFPGGGTQHTSMGGEFYLTEPIYREHVDQCAEFLRAKLGYDLKTLLYPTNETRDWAAAELDRLFASLPAIFVTEYALSKLLMSWGIIPDCMLGHSLGEYTAACLAGVFSLEDALSLVAFRGRLLEKLPPGAMLSIYCSESRVRSLIGQDISIAAINSADQCVVSGPVAAIDKLCDVLTAHDIEFRRLHIDAAAHSSMVESVTGEFFHFLSQFRFGTPSIPFVSNTTGTWITPAQACDPSYWVEHLRHTVRFSEGLTQLLSKDGLVLFETGPSNTLSNLAKSQCNERSSFIHACMRHPRIPASDIQVLHTTIAKAWNTGLPVNWLALYRAKTTRRLSLPTYPFERQRYWLNAHPTATDQEMEPNTVSPSAVQLYELTWKVSQDGSQSAANKGSFEDHWLVLSDDLGVGRALQELLQNHNQSVIFVAADPKFTSTGVNSYTVRPSSDRDMQCVLEHLNSAGIRKLKVVHLWQLTEVTQAAEQLEELDGILNRGLFSLVALSKALARIASSIELEFIAVTNHTIQMSGAEVIRPENNMFVAAARVIPAEVKNTTLRIIDFNIDSFSRQTCGRVANQVLAEALTNSSVPFVAYRGNQRWVPRYTAISSTSRKTYMQLKQGGVYLLTGGVGQLGPIVASFFASCVCCTLILTTRSPFPQRSEWEALARADKEDQVSRTARMLIDIEKQGSKIIVLTADAASELAMQAVFHELDTRFGTIDGVVHLAGVTGPQSLQLLTDLEKEVCIRQFLPKLQGCYVLSKLLADRPIDFCILFSSTASIFGGVGMSAYAAANGFLDSFSTTRHLSSDQRWITLNWDAWLTDMSPDFVGNGQTALDRFAISSKQALTMLQQALAHAPGGPYVVSTGHVEARIKEMFNTSSQTLHSPAVAELHKRPVLVSDYVAPRTISERNVGAIWQDVLGLERVGIHDNFFELGGNSLIGLKIVSKIKTMLHVHLPVTALFEAPTVATLAQIIDHAENDNYEDSRRRGELRRQQKLIPA